MKKTISGFLITSILIAMVSCKRGDHFIKEDTIRDKVSKQFEIRKELAKNRSVQLFGIIDSSGVTRTEKEALEFLYAYMSLNDLADYDGTFFLNNVRTSLSTRDTFSWGRKIPDNIFRHFVLPVRVNNENLDSSRWVFFSELKDRVRKLSMTDAVLEVNHWCHEKVTYRSSDERTSSPLASVKSAIGRCGEESTLTVAALRSVGIPARQCYTPRWAHCDDNHAWVEVWVDGKWNYIGACEPEPVLNMAWFTKPAKRAMLVNTNVFGDYSGPEDVLLDDPQFTRINILPGYTRTKRLFVKVTDPANNPADSAMVEFLLYNYAEFYPLTRSWTDHKGFCSFLTGLGDLVVWARKDDLSCFRKVTINNTDTLFLKLSHEAERDTTIDFDLTPPPDISIDIEVDEGLKKRNTERFEMEDRIRSNYEQTFIDSSKTWRLSKNLGLNPDTLWDFLRKSRGNWREIVDFITSVPKEKKNLIFPLLNSISEKDLRDVSPEVLSDHLISCSVYPPLTDDQSIIFSSILSPRVESEKLTSYKSYFRNRFEKSFVDKVRNNPDSLSSWVRSRIRIDEKSNYSRTPITPIGVFELSVSDPRSLKVFFVSLCRSFGIPARLEPGTRITQYLSHGKWIDVDFEKQVVTTVEKAKLTIERSGDSDRKPEYYINFTLQKLENGFYRSLDFEKEFPSWKFPQTIELTPGSYLVMTGIRLEDGTVLTRLMFFTLKAGESENISLSFRKARIDKQVYGTIKEVGKFLRSISSGSLFPAEKGVVVSWIDQAREPSRHFISDLISKKEHFDKWEGTIILLFKNKNETELFKSANEGKLPGKIKFGIASPGSLDILEQKLERPVSDNLPVTIFTDRNGDVLYFSEGYRIGSCEEIIRLISNQNHGR